MIAEKLAQEPPTSQKPPHAGPLTKNAAKKGKQTATAAGGGSVRAGSARSGSARGAAGQGPKINSARSGFTSSSTNKTGGVVKTIVLPHEDINRLSSEAQELMQVMQAQKALFDDTVSGYQKDRSVRTQEFDLKAQDFENTIAELE